MVKPCSPIKFVPKFHPFSNPLLYIPSKIICNPTHNPNPIHPFVIRSYFSLFYLCSSRFLKKHLISDSLKNNFIKNTSTENASDNHINNSKQKWIKKAFLNHHPNLNLQCWLIAWAMRWLEIIQSVYVFYSCWCKKLKK